MGYALKNLEKCAVCEKQLTVPAARYCRKHAPYVMTAERLETLRQNQKKTWFGRKVTEEHRKNLSLSHMGKRPSRPFKRGHTPWNAGKSETKVERVCVQCKTNFTPKYYHRVAKVCSIPCRNALNSGPRNKMWRGGITSESELIRKSLKYVSWRKSVMERDNFTCLECGQYGGQLQVDHIKPFALYPELRFDQSNGRTLCKGCHFKTDTWGGRVLSSRLKALTN